MLPAGYWARCRPARTQRHQGDPPHRKPLQILGLPAGTLPRPADRQLRLGRQAPRLGIHRPQRTPLAQRLLPLRRPRRLPVPYLRVELLPADTRHGILLPDQYSFRSSLSSALQCNWKVTEPGVSVLDMQQRIKEYRDIREYYYEDYYPLSGTGDLTGSDVWLAYQMHRPSDGSGHRGRLPPSGRSRRGIHSASGRTRARHLLYPRWTATRRPKPFAAAGN